MSADERRMRPWKAAFFSCGDERDAGTTECPRFIATYSRGSVDVAGERIVYRAPNCAVMSTSARSTSFAIRLASPQT